MDWNGKQASGDNGKVGEVFKFDRHLNYVKGILLSHI
jgi:hypothetical protein